MDLVVAGSNPVIHPENLCLKWLVFSAIFIMSIKGEELATSG